MRVRFHIPQRTRGLRALQEEISTEGPPAEPVRTEPPRSSSGTRFQRGGTRSVRSRHRAEPDSGSPRARYRAEPDSGSSRARLRAEPDSGASRRSQGQRAEPDGGTSRPRIRNRFQALRKKVVRKTEKSFVRSRKILTKKIAGENQDFGPFKEIVSMSNEGLDIESISEAKAMLKDTGMVPVTFKFFVDTLEIRNHKITSAEISFEKPASPLAPSSYTGTIISPLSLNLKFQQAGMRRKQKILNTMYVNFENVYDLTEEIEYKISVSPTRLTLMENIEEFAGANIVRRTLIEPVQIPIPAGNIIPPINTQYRNFSLGRSPDPGGEINRLPGTLPQPASGPSSALAGTSTFLRVTNILGGSSSGMTGTGLINNRMSVQSAALTLKSADIRTRNIVGFRSHLIPVIVTAAIPRFKYNSSMQVRIRLKSSNSLTDQVVAAGSKLYTVDDKYRACLLPMEPPEIKVTALGSGFVEIQAKQQDPAGSHATVFGKFFDKNGTSYGPWQKLKTFKCTNSATTILDFSNKEYDTAAIRVVSMNGIGYSSKYSASSIKNWRPATISDNDTIVGNIREMPTLITTTGNSAAILHVKNAEHCQQITIIREDLSTGNTNRVASSLLTNKRSIKKYDRSVKIGSTYRYYLMYKTAKSGETNLISHKDAMYTHRERSPEVYAIGIKSTGFSSSAGAKLDLSDDSIIIGMSVSIKKQGVNSILRTFRRAGIENLESNDVSGIMDNFDKFFATRTTRVNLLTGKREILSMQEIELDRRRFSIVDGPSTRENSVDLGMEGPTPGGKYTYITRLYYGDIKSMIGSDDQSVIPAQNPGLEQSVIRSPSRRFYITADTLRSVLPSENFVVNNDNFKSSDDAYERNFTGVEILTNVEIPSVNNFVKNVSVKKVTNEVMTITWDYGGDDTVVDHFVVLEKSHGKTVPVGAKIAFTTTGKHTFHLAGHEPEYDKTYIVKAYNEDGEVVAESASNIFIPFSPIPNDILKIHSIKSANILRINQGITL